RKSKPAGDVQTTLRPMISSSNSALRSEALKLAGKWKLSSFRNSLESAAASASEDIPIRCSAIEGLAGFRDAKAAETLHQIANGGSLQRIIAAAIVNELAIDDSLGARDAAGFF